MKQSNYTDKEGAEKTSLELTADHIGLVPRLIKRANTSNTEGEFPW
jgi:single-stranded DNA-binding protein